MSSNITEADLASMPTTIYVVVAAYVYNMICFVLFVCVVRVCMFMCVCMYICNICNICI